MTDAGPAAAAKLHRGAGDLATGPWDLALSPEAAGWSFSGLRVATLAAGGELTFDTGPDEVVVLPLAGAFRVACGDSLAELAGRSSVFAGPTDFAYAPPGIRRHRLERGRRAVRAAGGPGGPRGCPFRHVAAGDVPSSCAAPAAVAPGPQLRRRGRVRRRPADRRRGAHARRQLVARTRRTSTTRTRPGETVLEEIYYFEVAPGPAGARLRATSASTGRRTGRSTSSPRSATGDVVLIPHG